MEKYKIFVMISILTWSAASFASPESNEQTMITAELIMTELPEDTSIATIVRDDRCNENDDCKLVISCDKDPNVEDCYTESVDFKGHTPTQNDSLIEP
ncbi:hypothetical protein ACFODO_06480 [Acinetobacter sichuanensis]|uniref:Secreted protein n=1 Tax=Acinetobacter sichuanensis TaxID=2136183 RepID=A0A371YQL0_9GAMM|nr:hypothetical protein [Acinetobacter sichuanensis]RFC83765.1 hypothetical protein C9E89_009895 [Acinetobacter sichuanensis]